MYYIHPLAKPELNWGLIIMQMVSTLLQVQDLGSKADCAKPLHVVASINHPKTKDVAQHLSREAQKLGSCCTVDLLLPDELSSGVLTQARLPKDRYVLYYILGSVTLLFHMACH